jgi:hypothetical protein
VRVAATALAGALVVLGADTVPATAAPAECASIHARGIDRQMNLRASEILVKCGVLPAGPAAGRPAASSATAPGLSFVGSDVNLITGTETSPKVTQSESFGWSQGNTIVVTYNDSRGSPQNYSGVSVSHDGGVTFTRSGPSSPFTGHVNNFGDPTVVYNANLGTWFASFLAAGAGAGTCGAQGIGLWTSTTGDTWTAGVCAHTGAGSGDDRQSMWVDNNAASPFYGRMYISFNDFNASGALKVTHSDDGTTWTTPVTLLASFRRNVQLTGSPGADGAVFLVALDENGGGVGNTGQQNFMYRSLDGGVTWSSTTMGPTFTIPGGTLCSGSTYFPTISPIWRQTGYGTPAVGPGGVVHYVYAAHGTAADEADIFYVRSTDSGVTWDAPVRLNTDSSGKEQWMPSVRVTPSGIVEASWYDRRNTTDGTNYERLARISSNNGVTWGADQAISTVLIPQPTQPDPNVQACYAGDYNYTTANANTGFDHWTDGRVSISAAPQQDVFFHSIPLRLPTATAGAAGATTSSTVVLNGLINPGGQATNWKVQWGPTPALGSETAPVDAGSGAADVAVTTTLTGLTAGATYYYKFVANTDSGGSGESAVQTVTPRNPLLPGGGGGGGGVGAASGGGASAPVISSVHLSSSVFRGADRGASLTARRKKKERKTGTNVRYSESQAATTTFTVLTPTVGHRKGRRCLAGRPSSRQRRCTRLQSLGSFAHRDRAGSVKVHFTGRVRGRKLPPGRYLLALTPRANGKTGRTAQLSFRIIS